MPSHHLQHWRQVTYWWKWWDNDLAGSIVVDQHSSARPLKCSCSPYIYCGQGQWWLYLPIVNLLWRLSSMETHLAKLWLARASPQDVIFPLPLVAWDGRVWGLAPAANTEFDLTQENLRLLNSTELWLDWEKGKYWVLMKRYFTTKERKRKCLLSRDTQAGKKISYLCLNLWSHGVPFCLSCSFYIIY